MEIWNMDEIDLIKINIINYAFECFNLLDFPLTQNTFYLQIFNFIIIMSLMRKWEQQKNKTTHHKKISNVKSVLNTTVKTNHSERSREKKSQQKQKQTTQKKSRLILPRIQSCPLYNILKNFELEQYTHTLIELGYGYDLTKFRNLSQKKRQYMISQIKLQPAHRMKFETLINYLSILMNNIFDMQIPTIKRSQNHLPKINQSRRIVPKNFVEINKKSINIKKKSKSKGKPPLPKKYQDSPFSAESTSKLSKVSAFTYDKRNLFKFSYHDDISITHKYINGKQEAVYEQNKIIRNLRKKLEALKPKQAIDLQISKIKNMYLSFDSATLTSNIINLDQQELCFCFSSQIMQLIKIVKGKSESFQSKTEYQSTTSMIPIIVNKQDTQQKSDRISKTDRNDQSLKITPIKEVYKKQKLQIIQEKQQEVFQSILQQKKEVLEDILKNSLAYNIRQDDQESNLARRKTSEQSSAFQSTFEENQSYIEFDQNSRTKKFKQFDEKSKQLIYTFPPNIQIILNFIKNIIITAKMQKEVPIIAHVYLCKLLECSQQNLTQYNWRNIVLICLVIGSKIWDDTSLQNHSISKVITTHTTIQLNHLQKIFLWFIDYRLTIDQKQYSASFFKLRNHIKQSKKSVSLRPLNLQAIKRLQSNANNLEYKLKQKYKKLMNKSF